MDNVDRSERAGDELVRQDLITREELELAREREAASGTPWYKQLVQTGKVTFGALEDVLRYEFHFDKTKQKEHQSLGQALVELGHLSEGELKKALDEQKRSGRLLGNILIDQGYVSLEQKTSALARQHGMEYADLEDAPSEPEALHAVPESMAIRNLVVPVAIDGDRLTVLLASPQDTSRTKNLGIQLNLRIHPILAPIKDIQATIKARYRALDSGDEAAEGLTAPRAKSKKRGRQNQPTQSKPSPKKQPPKVEVEEAMVEDDVEYEEVEEEAEAARFEEIARQASGSSVINMVRTIIEGAVNAGATDIHLDPQEPEMRVRYRINGMLHDVMSIPENTQNAVISRLKIMSDMDITEARHPQDGHFSLEFGDDAFDIRVATLPTFLGERIVLRILAQSAILSGIKDLGLEPEDEKKLTRIIAQPYGMILVTGPTGSGKTTTLYAALNQKNVMTDSIVTLEDPVEYQISGINQVQIDTDIDRTFASTLRASLRQDIDVLLVGEIRDADTAQIAIRAAMTGHLVFSTLHTNDSPEAVSTLRNMGVPSYLISSALTAVVGQRLVRTICTECRKGFKPNATLLKSLSLPTTTKKLYRGAGCEECYQTGSQGRCGVFEILEVDNTARELISHDASTEELRKKLKIKTLADRCLLKVKRGEVAPEEYLRTIRL